MFEFESVQVGEFVQFDFEGFEAGFVSLVVGFYEFVVLEEFAESV